MSARELFSERGAAAAAMIIAEKLGTADGRWRLIPETALARLAPMPDPEGGLVHVLMAALPKFIKIKWECGELRTAKVYFEGRSELFESSEGGRP